MQRYSELHPQRQSHLSARSIATTRSLKSWQCDRVIRWDRFYRGEPRMVARQIIFQLRHRNFILCYLGAESYAFIHRTFLEYFCAAEFVWQFKETQTLTIDKLINEVFATHWQDETWHELLRLICGSIEAKFVADIVDYLLEQWIDRGEFLQCDRLKKEGLSNLILAVNCFEEVRNKQAIFRTEALLMKTLEQEIDGETYILSPEAAFPLTSLVATIGSDRVKTLQYLKGCLELTSSASFFVPSFAVTIVAEGWKDDPDTLGWLKHLTQNDENGSVRHKAIEVIVREWKDDLDTLSMLKHHAQNDPDRTVRSLAIKAIIQGWKESPKIFEFFAI